MRKLKNLDPIDVLSWGYVVTALPVLTGGIIAVTRGELTLTLVFISILIAIDYHFRLCLNKLKGTPMRRLKKLTPTSSLGRGYVMVSLFATLGASIAVSKSETVLICMFASILILACIISGLSFILSMNKGEANE